MNIIPQGASVFLRLFFVPFLVLPVFEKFLSAFVTKFMLRHIMVLQQSKRKTSKFSSDWLVKPAKGGFIMGCFFNGCGEDGGNWILWIILILIIVCCCCND